MANEISNLQQFLSNLKIDQLNEMQLASLEAHKKPEDLIILSATGSGKTLAFLLPLLTRLDKTRGKTQAMIVVPSRELALQIESVFKRMGTGFKVTCCYGGHLRETEENNLIQPPELLIGTPGRLCDHIRRNNITLESIETLVLDEFDKSLELGFHEEVSFILASLNKGIKKILTSATEAESFPEFLELNEPVQLDFLTGVEAETGLAIKTVWSEEKDKAETLFKLICHTGGQSTIVFCNHRDSVEWVSAILSDKGINNEFYHGGLEQQQRDSALSKFRNGTTNVLITTDLASRGLDIPFIRYIVHYHLPVNEETFTHRNGRTARMDATGTAVLILSEGEVLPGYVPENAEKIIFQAELKLPDKPKWTTLFIGAGRKDKVNKGDIAGFLSHRGELKKEDIGLIEVKDFFSFVAIRKTKANHTLQLIKNERIKNKKVKIDVAK